MIDTIRFKVAITERNYKILEKFSNQVTSYDHPNKRKIFDIFKIHKNIGSFNRKINIFLSDYDCCFLELSLPKYIHGDNVFMLDVSKLKEYIYILADELHRTFDGFPFPVFWELERIDLCYAWKTENDMAARHMLSLIETIQYPRRQTYRYGTSIMFLGQNDSLKFYMKHPEVYEHDFKEVKKTDYDRAIDILNKAEGVLRFEVTMRKKAIIEHFGTQFLTEAFNYTNILRILNMYLEKILRLKNNDIVSREDAVKRLFKLYTPAKAARLYQFMTLYYGGTPTDHLILSRLTRATKSYNLIQLKKAGIGFLDNTPGTVSIQIPSDYCVPTLPAPA